MKSGIGRNDDICKDALFSLNQGCAWLSAIEVEWLCQQERLKIETIFDIYPNMCDY
jgi:hypothetical protein